MDVIIPLKQRNCRSLRWKFIFSFSQSVPFHRIPGCSKCLHWKEGHKSVESYYYSFCEIKQQTLNIKSSAKSNNQLTAVTFDPSTSFSFYLTNLFVALKKVKVSILFKKKLFEITF